MLTSLEQIKSFRPCESGWRTLITARAALIGQSVPSEAQYTEKFLIEACVETNSISDVCWLLGKLKHKSILVKFAGNCAASVAHLKKKWDDTYAAEAAEAAAEAAAYAAAAKAYAKAAEAAYAAAEAAAADIYAAAAYAAAKAAKAAEAAREKHITLCKTFLVKAIQEFDKAQITNKLQISRRNSNDAK